MIEKLLNILLIISNGCFDIFFVKISLDCLIHSRKENRSTPVFILTAITGEVILYMNMYLLSGNHSIEKGLFTVLLNILVYYLLSLFYNANLVQRILVVVVLQFLNAVSEILCAPIFQSRLTAAHTVRETFLAESLISFSCQIVSFFFLMITILYWRRHINRYPSQYHISVLIMPLISFSLLFALSDESILFRDSIFVPIALCGLLMINVLNFYLLENMLKAQYLSYQKSHLEKQLNIQKQHFDALTTAYRSTRRVIHDTKKHLFYLRSGIEQGKTDELTDSINTFLGDLERSYINTNTGNLAIDALVGNYKTMSIDKNISFIDHLEVDRSKIHLPDYDMCIILGNLLENAFQAACKQTKDEKSYIRLIIAIRNEKLIIQVINSYHPSLTERKHQDFEHGYGLENIRNTVKKWNGQFCHSINDEHAFQADVVIPLPITNHVI